MITPRLRYYNKHSSPATYRSLSRQRVEALTSYAIIDTEPETDFDQITRLAASVCQTPMAAMSLLDGERQWFKSRVGLGLTETPLDISFCIHAIQQPHEVTVVTDATCDERFRKSPFVTENPRARFYAGAPILTPAGVAVGALCVLDLRPRELTTLQHDTLKCLASWVTTFLEKRRIHAECSAAQQHLRNLAALVPACSQSSSRPAFAFAAQ